MSTKTDWKLSASSISAFKACPTRFRYGYVEGIRADKDTDALRIGSTWHTLLEIATMKPGGECLWRNCLPDCPICSGAHEVADEEPLDRAVRYLDSVYDHVPDWADLTDWAVERQILAVSLAGWLWLYQGSPIETIERERPFKLPLRNPETGRALPHVKRVGKIDRIVKWGNRLMVGEYKSTSKAVDGGSTLWDRLNLDSQISHYCLSARELAAAGEIDGAVSGVLYDVWHKPTIRPKKLTQGGTGEFLDTGEYFGQRFEVTKMDVGSDYGPCMLVPAVNGEQVEVTFGAEKKPTKKNPNPERPFAIRETPAMYGARLLTDITERPEFYYARREIARTDADLAAFEWEMYNIYQSMRTMDRSDHWFHNESQCEATFKCSYCPLCYHNVDVCDGKTTPPGYKRIFDLDTSTETDE